MLLIFLIHLNTYITTEIKIHVLWILILESCHKLPSYVRQALANSLLFINPLFVRKEKVSPMRRVGWLTGPKNQLINKAKGGKGVRVMEYWMLLILSSLSSTE